MENYHGKVLRHFSNALKSIKMVNATPLFTSLRDVLIPGSNVTPVLTLSKVILLLPNPLLFSINENQFATTNSKRYQRVSSTLVILLHLAVTLKWRLGQWVYPDNQSPISTWKLVYIYYCITLYVAVLIFIGHLAFLKEETIALLNSAMQMEREVNAKGEVFSK